MRRTVGAKRFREKQTQTERERGQKKISCLGVSDNTLCEKIVIVALIKFMFENDLQN